MAADEKAQSGEVGVLVHNEGDDVAVAIRDLQPGEVVAAWLDSERRAPVAVAEEVPFGHKVALKAIESGADVIEYGVRIGYSREKIAQGQLVHTHNVRSARWELSA